jgi:hypothetical protein
MAHSQFCVFRYGCESFTLETGYCAAAIFKLRLRLAGHRTSSLTSANWYCAHLFRDRQRTFITSVNDGRSAKHRDHCRDTPSGRSVDPGGRSAGNHREGLDRPFAVFLAFRGSMDCHCSGSPQRGFGDGRTGRMVHRRPAVRQAAHQYTGTLEVLFSPPKVAAPDLTIRVFGRPTIEPTDGWTIQGWRQTETAPQSVHNSEEGTMTRTEADRFRDALTARIAELEGDTTVTPSQLSEAPISSNRYRRLHNEPSRYVTSTVNSTNFETPVRPYAVSRKATSEPARSAMRTSTRSGLPRCRGLHFAYGARKPSTAILPATWSVALLDAGLVEPSDLEFMRTVASDNVCVRRVL